MNSFAYFQWETSLNELGELEFLVTQSLDKPPKPVSRLTWYCLCIALHIFVIWRVTRRAVQCNETGCRKTLLAISRALNLPSFESMFVKPWSTHYSLVG